MLSDSDSHRQDIRKISRIPEVPLILDVCRETTGMGFTAVARVTEDRWITCASLDYVNFGLLPGDELEVGSTICQEVRACQKIIVIPDVDASAQYRDHDTPRRYGFKSYISVPVIRTDGSFWGTLCGIDPSPRDLGPTTAKYFQLFAQLIALELDRQEELEAGRAALATERDTARLREEFIAVVGHDLRNPIAAVSSGLRLLNRRGFSESQIEALVPEMQRSLTRASQIITNLMDFARGRLGAGIQLESPRGVDLGPVLHNVVSEIAQVAAQPVDCDIDLPAQVHADPQRLGQLLSNLLGNAVTHGSQDDPIRVVASLDDGMLRIAVTNQGPPIPEQIRASLFMPFARGGSRSNSNGLGLGLYIASEIAKAHHGRIDVVSSEDDGTTFTLTMPASPPGLVAP